MLLAQDKCYPDLRMGLLFVLVFWAISGSILAILAALAIHLFVLWLTRQVPESPQKRK
jgi:hypothetical protein